MKKYLKFGIILTVSSILSACANFDLSQIIKSQGNPQLEQTIPSAFGGKWVNKKNRSYCTPPPGDYLEQPLLIINPKQNHLEWLTWSEYRIIKFNSLSDRSFNAEVEVTSIEIDPDDVPSISRKNLSAKLINQNTILIDNKKYYRCP